jgi:hypothetical protein
MKLVLCTILAACLCVDQAGRGGISGLVTDASGARVPAASVEAVNPATGVTLQTKTNSAGPYSFNIPGIYCITVTHPGFQTIVREGLPVEVDRFLEVNVDLVTGQLQRPDLVCDPEQDMPRRAEQWITPSCFAAPAGPFVPGNAPRTLNARNDGALNVDLSLAKNFPFGESVNLQLRVESFNLTNSVQLGRPGVGYNPRDVSPFGRITSAYSTPRQFQFAAKFTF